MTIESSLDAELQFSVLIQLLKDYNIMKYLIHYLN